MKFLLKYWRRYRFLFFTGISFLTMEACCDLLQPAIASRIIDNGVKNRELNVVLRYACIMLLVTLFGACCAVMRNHLASRVSQYFVRDLRLDLFTKIYGFSFDELGKHSAATLITRMTNDTTQLQNFANGLMRIFIKGPLICIGSVVMVFFLNLRLAAILSVAAPMIMLTIYLSMKAGFPFFARMQVQLDRNNGVIREYLSGVRVVKAFNTFKQEEARFKESNSALAHTAVSANRVMAVFNPIIMLWVNLSVIFLLWNAQPLIRSEQLNIGEIIAFINYMAQILFSMIMIFNVYQQFIRAKASAERISEIMNLSSPDEAGSHPADKLTGHIRFDNVSFTYPGAPGRPALKDISFEMYPRETVGVIGSTGSGKTTLIQLIPGFYKPGSGSVLLDGLPAHTYDPEKLRESISVVAQTAQLFTGTIADNIRWGKEGATEDEVVAAAKVAQAHGFITSFPAGYDTWVGQHGVNLSGGQKQRLSIARAIIRDTKILLLDDCVSAVDVETEAAIMAAINEISKELTCMLVSQRGSSLMRLPKILVLDEGGVAGLGTHEELLKNCTVYREICRSQLGALSGADGKAEL